jgi:deazaflavin-dependent oxidoreductase (nitroreductase family)
MARSPYADFTQGLINDLRAHGGHASSGPFVGRDLLLLTTKGARSGELRTTPLTYTRNGDNYVIVASKSGADTHPSWYRNLLANPQATIEVGDETIPVVATEADASERRRLYDAHARINPVFGDYELKTTRVIPVFVLERAG